VNVRSSTLVPLEDAADLCRDHDAILEINAHCRQEEMCTARAGEALLHQPGRLCRQVEAATATGATVGVKVRAEVDGVDLPALTAELDAAGADLIHVDAMDSESVVADVVDAVDAFRRRQQRGPRRGVGAGVSRIRGRRRQRRPPERRPASPSARPRGDRRVVPGGGLAVRSVAQNAELAFLLEVTSTPKPGNVDRRHEYDDLRFEHFLAGAVGARPGFDLAADGGPIGEAF